MALAIDDKRVVSVHYKLTDDDGNVIDSSEGAEPLPYLHGAGTFIPGLEKAMTGKVEGDAFKVVVEPAEGYGEVIPELIQIVDKEAFEEVESLEVGMAFEANDPEGAVQQLVVKEINDDKVTIDANHPLAGMRLHFDINIIAVREATEEELSHGHAHEGEHAHECE